LDAGYVAAEEEDSPSVMKEVLAKLPPHSKTYEEMKRQFLQRKLRLSTMKHAKARQELLDSNMEGFSSRKAIMQKASMMDTSRDLSASLQRTTQLVSQELQRLAETEQVLHQDSATLDSTDSEYNTYKNSASNADMVLKDIQKREKMDWYIIIVCFCVFMAVVIYIIWKRTAGWFIDLSVVYNYIVNLASSDEQID